MGGCGPLALRYDPRPGLVIVFGLGLAVALLALARAQSDPGPCPAETNEAAREEARLLLEAGRQAVDAGRFEE
ncbi:MAG TPA: hypothetical protein VI589_14575, partial [Vicinamibacteria bacterium]